MPLHIFHKYLWIYLFLCTDLSAETKYQSFLPNIKLNTERLVVDNDIIISVVQLLILLEHTKLVL